MGRRTVEEEEVEEEEVQVQVFQMQEEEGTIESPHADSASKSTDRDEMKPWPIAYKGFFAMIHLFEAAAVRSMAPEKAKEGVFPTEICEIILEYVDNVTYQACTCVSRKFRRCCHIALRMVEDTVIHGLDSNAEATQSWDTTSFVLSRGPKGKRSTYQLKSYYGRHIDGQDSTVWVMICGSSQRSTLPLKFLFLGYAVPGTWYEIDHQDAFVEGEGLQYQRCRPAEIDVDISHYWDQDTVLDRLMPMAQMNMRPLHQVWATIIKSYGMPQYCDDDRFRLLSHTKEVIIETEWLHLCVGHIWIKRPDAVVGFAEAWELALKEAEAEVSMA